MHEQSDAQLLREYAQHQDEAAFREIVQRHADLVYASALRQMGSPDLARDVAQSVFTDLARKARSVAGTLAGNASLLGWLFRSTRYVALNQVRNDRRRQARERQAMEDFDPVPETAPEWDRVQPVLDEAMAELSGEDRDALLLRFFKNSDFRSIGATLGVSDDAAQKRVSRALERLRAHLTSRGVTTSAVALATALTANAVPLAPAGLAAMLSTSALAGTTLATTTATALKTIAMTTLQKTFISAALLAAVGVGIYEARQAANLQSQVQTLQQQQGPLAEKLERLARERDEAVKGLAAVREEVEQLRKDRAELPKLRGEIGRLRNDAQELSKSKAGNSNANDPTMSEAVSWKERVTRLKQHLEENPGAKIPELQFTTEDDWLNAARGKLENEKDYRRALSSLRSAGESKFIGMLQPALKKYMAANNQQFPTDVAQLQPYFQTPVEDAVFQRYAVLPAEAIPSLRMGGKWIISQRSPIDPEYDSRLGIGPSGYGNTGSQSWDDSLATTIKTLEPVMKAYAAANGGSEPADPQELLPYLKTPEQKAAFEKGLKAIKASRGSDDQ